MVDYPDEQQDQHETVDKDGYQLTFYPGFVRRCAIHGRDGKAIVLYEQTEVFHLPDGETESLPRSRMHLRGGEQERDFGLTIDDPEHQIARITVELFPPGFQTGGEEEGEIDQTVIIEEHPVKCPPYCDEKLPPRTGRPPKTPPPSTPPKSAG